MVERLYGIAALPQCPLLEFHLNVLSPIIADSAARDLHVCVWHEPLYRGSVSLVRTFCPDVGSVVRVVGVRI